jgi:hypothetical protein
MSKTQSVQFQAGSRAFKEGRHTNPYSLPPIRWHRDWQRGYDYAATLTSTPAPAAAGEQAEPVATVLPGSGYLAEVPNGLPPGTKLYAAQVAKEPLTEEQRHGAFCRAEKVLMVNPNRSWRDAIADEIERAHGIAAKEQAK